MRMTITVLAVGRLRPALRDVCEDYLGRLQRFADVVEREVREAPGSQSPAEQRRTEGKRLLAAAPDPSRLIALDREGVSWSSVAFATQLDRWRAGAKPLALVIGGSLGLDQAVLARADYRWSLGPLTFTHELARVIALEQLFRAGTILRGERYHK